MAVVLLARNWWTIALRGALAILFGALTFVWPGLTITALVLLFAAYAFVDGVFAITAGVRGFRRDERWWAFLLQGAFGVTAAFLTVVWPGITALVLLYLIAAWALVTGVLEIVAAIRLRREITGEWLLALGGVASIAFGVLLVMAPGAGALAVVWLIGAYALFFGVLLLALAFRLRSWGRTFGPGAGVPHPA